ncbi:hypothetical protein SPILM97S_04449 [Streptomyces pilosus]
MAASGGDVPWVQLVQRVLLVRAGRGRVRRGPGHVLIPAVPRSRAGPTQCRPFGSASGHMGTGRNLRRGATAGGESSLAARSCQSEAASRAGGDRWGAGGGTRGDVEGAGRARCGGSGRPGHGLPSAPPRGDRVVRHRGRPFARLVGTHGLTAGPGPRLVGLSSGPPGFLARPRSPVNVLSGHSDENMPALLETSRPVRPPGTAHHPAGSPGPRADGAGRHGNRPTPAPTRGDGSQCAPPVSRSAPVRHSCHKSSGAVTGVTRRRTFRHTRRTAPALSSAGLVHRAQRMPDHQRAPGSP